MKRPGKDEKRVPLYLVQPARGEWFGTAGQYIGETPTHVVLKIGDGARGFLWSDVEPVLFKETEAS